METIVSSHLPARGGSGYYRYFTHLDNPFPVTSPRGEDPVCKVVRGYAHAVSSHLPARGGSVSVAGRDTGFGRFQSPPREGRIHARQPDGKVKGGFQSPPREGRIRWVWASTRPTSRFQSPPREGRILPLCHVLDGVILVSSHLPARGGSPP